MTGIASPEDGIGRVIIPDAAIALVLVSSDAAAAPASVRATSRRVILEVAVIAGAAKHSPEENAASRRLLRRFALAMTTLLA
jgi:hypothetical protein